MMLFDQKSFDSSCGIEGEGLVLCFFVFFEFFMKNVVLKYKLGMNKDVK